MGLIDKTAFVGGELDPVLWERTNLDKFRNGLATARNVVVSRTGSVLSRPGRALFNATKLVNRACLLYSPPGSGLLLEWGHLYVRVYSLATFGLLADVAHPFLESDLPNVHFETSGSFVYIFCAGKNILKLNYVTRTFTAQNIVFAVPPAPFSYAVTPIGTPGGYAVQYAITYVLNGEESLFTETTNYNLPIATGQQNQLSAALAPAAAGANFNPFITEMRVYRRPYQGGAYGFIGSSSYFFQSGPSIIGSFNDVGQGADYSHSPPADLVLGTPTTVTGNTDPGSILLSNTGVVYQQRLLITDAVTDLQAIYAGQPGFPDNFQQTFPFTSASALKFKSGTSGYARVYRMLDSDGLVVFTEAGVYLNQGTLGPENLSLEKKGKWIINASVPPLAVPGGVIFLDRSTNGVRNLLWSLQVNAYTADEVSRYSNHLFRTRQVATWHFQEGIFPLLYVVFNDGSMATFTFEFEQQMQAWTRHDGVLPVKSGCGTNVADQSFFVTAKTDINGNVTRYIEYTLPRFVPPQTIAADPDWDKNPSIAYMDGIITYYGLLNNQLKTGEVFEFSTTVPDDWTQNLNLTCGTSAIFKDPGPGTPGTILRFFDEDKSAIDVTVVSRTDDNNLIVSFANVSEFPQRWARTARLYLTTATIGGLSHLEGENPSVIVDGAVICSPNNDVDNYPVATVTGASLTLPGGISGAIIHIGRPIIGDVETLDIDTVEQQPVLLESLVVDKLYVKVHKSQGLFVGNKFPNGQNGTNVTGVQGMSSLDSYDVDYTDDVPIIGNRAQQNKTKRVELTLPGDWKSKGHVCVRQVDPLHFEILSFIPDVEVLKRSDRT